MLWLARAVRTHSRMITMVCSWPWAARPIRTVGDQCDERHAAAPRSPPACSGDQRARARMMTIQRGDSGSAGDRIEEMQCKLT